MTFLDSVQQRHQQVIHGLDESDKGLRTRAWAEFERLGLPDRRNENWKYSSVSQLVKSPWRFDGVTATLQRALEVRDRYKDTFDVVVIHNGAIQWDQSTVSQQLWTLWKLKPSHDLFLFGDGFTCLSAAVAGQGVSLSIPADTQMARPILILRSQDGEGLWSSTLNSIEVGAGSQVAVAEIFISEGTNTLRSDLTKVIVQDNARLRWLRWQNESLGASHFSDVRVELRAQSECEFTQLTSGAKWSRSVIRFDAIKPQAKAVVRGVTFGQGEQHLDQRVVVNHRSPLTVSQQLFKSVLKDKARGILNGKIQIDQDAQQVESSQLSHNLLLSPGAEADTKPELEVYADDVKANHGASIGRMDKDKLFYLTSRGLTPSQARQVLARAFVADVMMKIENPSLRQVATDSVEMILPSFVQGMEHS